ncbi:MAG: hypothetical protein ACTTHM_10280 [Peptoanaerobacter stomatis]|uniref:hypothetical protein n=1 Tax=Peptoanaerobacter stomatis TaxID=796937 RepID=UPI003FA0F6EA
MPRRKKDRTTEYAKLIVSGLKICGTTEYLCCKRHLDDLQKSKTKDFEYKFDVEEAAKGDDEVVTKGKFNVNGKELEIDRILKEGHNYIKVKDLEKAGFKINYIQETKTVKIDSN